MALLLRCDSLGKSFGDRLLFHDISISFDDQQRIGLFGPNGAGKSTLLKILAGLETSDTGELTTRRQLRLGYVPQQDDFEPGHSVLDIVAEAILDPHVDAHDRQTQAGILLGKIGFDDPTQLVETLSGGWRKRLSIARQLINQPDFLLLDEPTNHLDLEGIEWLEKMLSSAPFAFLLVSHDRVFLENSTNRIVELNSSFANGYFSVNGNYSTFLEQKEQYLAAQASLEASLAGRVRREIEWLKRGARARTTKAKGRIDNANELKGQLDQVRQRNSAGGAAGIDFVSSGRQTRKLIDVKKLAKSLGGKTLFRDVEFTLAPGSKLGLLGPNGSGKTTLIRLLAGQIEPDAGTIRRADGLRLVLFDQARAALDQQQTLAQALSDGSPTILFRGQSMHISGWAKRFLFRTQQLDMAVRELSGGEQARVLIARLMLQPADVLILDEPTNDLDISSLEILEESLADFPGALVLVTHDRYLLDSLATEVLGLDGRGGAAVYADRAQYERARNQAQRDHLRQESSAKKTTVTEKKKPRGLSYMEQREWDQIEPKIMQAEEELTKKQEALGSPEVMADHRRMAEAGRAVADAQMQVDALYRRWQALDAKRAD